MTTTNSRTSVLVVGATGKQGGATVTHLLSGEHGEFEVYGLTRDAESEGSRALAERGVTVVEGDLADETSLREPIERVDSVFAITDYFGAGGYEGDVEHGTKLGELAADAGIDHYVFSSVEGAERSTGIPFFDSKYEVERHLRALDLPLTILRPTNFMQNFEGQREEIEAGTLATPLDERIALQMVDTDDIGALAATAFATPDRYVGETVPIASDEATPGEMAATFGDVLDIDVTIHRVPIEGVRAEMGAEYAAMYEWLNDAGHEVGIEALRAETGIDLGSFETYLRREWV